MVTELISFSSLFTPWSLTPCFYDSSPNYCILTPITDSIRQKSLLLIYFEVYFRFESISTIKRKAIFKVWLMLCAYVYHCSLQKAIMIIMMMIINLVTWHCHLYNVQSLVLISLSQYFTLRSVLYYMSNTAELGRIDNLFLSFNVGISLQISLSSLNTGNLGEQNVNEKKAMMRMRK